MFRKLFLIPMLIAAISLSSYAASMAVTSVSVQAEAGILYTIAGGLSVAPITFVQPIFFVATPAPASPSPCLWTAASNLCQTTLTAGDWFFYLALTLNKVPSAATTYTALVVTNQGTFPSISFSVPSTAAVGWSGVFYLDLGTGTLNSPITLHIIVS